MSEFLLDGKWRFGCRHNGIGGLRLIYIQEDSGRLRSFDARVAKKL